MNKRICWVWLWWQQEYITGFLCTHTQPNDSCSVHIHTIVIIVFSAHTHIFNPPEYVYIYISHIHIHAPHTHPTKSKFSVSSTQKPCPHIRALPNFPSLVLHTLCILYEIRKAHFTFSSSLLLNDDVALLLHITLLWWFSV